MAAVAEQIASIRARWGKRLVILGHHYQRSSVLRHADETGDSLELARQAAARPEAERIVFCGVRFMAESADVLTGPGQTVYMPEASAGCPMADMADAETMRAAWETLQRARPGAWLPVVYVNSAAEIKALCGAWGGSTCTSSNAARVFEWARSRGKGVFFLPDEHLGRNTAADLDIAENAVASYDPQRGDGGLSAETIRRCEIVVWKGFCRVHTAFTAEQVHRVRRSLPGASIIVHPEVPLPVVRETDAHGSTSQIIRYVADAPAGATVVIGTEVNLVSRLAEEHKGRVTVKALSSSVCADMARTNEANLLALLETWPAACEVHVPESVAEGARQALSRMLAL